MGSAQVGVRVSAQASFYDPDHSEGAGYSVEGIINEVWRWQRSATEFGGYSDIPASEGGTSNAYTPSAGDLGMWLRVKVTFDNATDMGLTAEATTQQPVLWEPVVSNAGFAHYNDEGFTYGFDPPVTQLLAQGFTTGPDPRGYLVVGARLLLYWNTDGIEPEMTWAVHADDAGKPTAEPLAAALPILNIDSVEDTFEELTHPNGVQLQPSAKYWIVVSKTTPSSPSIDFGAWSIWSSGVLTSLGFEDQIRDPDQELGPAPLDQGSDEGWSVDFEALTYGYDDSDQPLNDPGTLCTGTTALSCDDLAALLPWRPLAHGLELHRVFLLQMSLLDAPEVTVQFTQDSYSVDEGGTQAVDVELSADPHRTVTIPITATGEGGADSTDYSSPTSVTFNAGETSKAISLTATQDTVDDDDESVKLEFGTMPDVWVSAGTTDEKTVIINDDDDPEVTVQFGQSTYAVAEGGTQEVTVTLSADPERTVEIPLTHTAQHGADSADYSGVPGSVAFASGETSKTFTISATDDTVGDDDETVLLEFGTMPDTRVSAGTTAETTVSITDNDDPAVTVQFGQDSQGVGEGETVNVTISLSADPERTVTIPVTATGQDGATTADYSVPTSVTFNAGEPEKTIAFMATEDDDDDDDESVKLEFGTMPDRVSEGTRTETTLDIGDDDPMVTVTFSQTTCTVNEGATQQVTVTVSADPERTIIIPITTTLQGTASDADYSGVSPSVTFTDGTAQTFTFAATQDLIDDDGEGLLLGFGNMPDPRVSAPAMNELTLNITDDDTADIVLSPLALTIEESDSTDYTVSLATEPTVDVTVTISGHAGTDLTLTGGRLSNYVLTFTPANWNTPQTVTVTAAHDDDGVNDDETLTHTAAGGEYAALTKALRATINDDDPPEIVLSPLALTVEESDSADYTVSLATEPTVDVNVTITGHSGTDLTLSGPTLTNDALTFTAANWNTLQTVTVTAAHDDDTDDDTATLTHTSAGGEYDALTKSLQVDVDDNTGDLRLVDGTMTDPGNNGDPSEGRLELFYDGEWCTICDDYWNEDEADVACRLLGFEGGSVEDWERFRNSFFPQGAPGQTIVLDDLRCSGDESSLLECRNRGVGVHNCLHFEDVGLRCIQNSVGPHITNMVISAAPGTNGKYDVGETVTVTWSEAVNVNLTPSSGTHPPHLHLSYGRIYAPTTEAVYTSGTGTASTVFTATVEDRGNAPYDSMLIPKESLSTEIWNATPGLDPVGSYITSTATGIPATLEHPFYPGPGSSQQVEAAAIVAVPSFNDPGTNGEFGSGDTVEVTFTFNRPVQVDTSGGTPSVEVLLSGTDAKHALYLRGSGTRQLVFGYTLAEEDGQHSSLLIEPDSLALNGGTIRDAADPLAAGIEHQGAGVPVGHRGRGHPDSHLRRGA